MMQLLADLEYAISLNTKLRNENKTRPEVFEESEEDLYSLLHTVQGIATED